MKICIDPGHGGEDPGAIGILGDLPCNEKDINLTAAFMLAGVLNSFDHKALMTRIGDETMTLQGRCDQASDMDCDLFISIHCNSFGSSVPRGFEIYHYPNSEKGIIAAYDIFEKVRFIPWLEIHGIGVKEATFHVLRYTSMPAVYIELSFMSNVEDLANLLILENLFLLMRLIGKAVSDNAPA